MNKYLLALVMCLATISAHATIIQFDLYGTAGTGLLPGNEGSLNTPSTGSGGEYLTGISFNDATLVLSISVAWGSVKGFADLTGAASAAHIHGPVSVAQAGTFTGSTGIPSGFGLTPSPSAANDGLITANITFSSTQAGELMQGRYYINVHTSGNPSGEMRGFLNPVPEPGTSAMLALGAMGLLARRRR